jgi:hypothetical protein
MVSLVPALLLAALLCATPPVEGPVRPEPIAREPDAPAEPEQPPTPVIQPSDVAEPSLVEPPAVAPPAVDPDELGPPSPTLTEPPEPPGPDDDPDDDPFAVEPPPVGETFDYPERSWADMPYFPTAARKSADQRNNDMLVRPFRQPIYSIAAAARFAYSLPGRDVLQPFGFGFAAQLRIHFARVVKSRFGVEVYAGYTRFPRRVEYAEVEGSRPLTRLDLLGHTDVSAGPSMQIPLGPVFLQFGASAGVAFSTLTRTYSAEAVGDELRTSTDALLRGGASLGVPVLNRHGLSFGAGVQHVFSRERVVIDLQDPDGPTARPFGTWIEAYAAYQIWF